MPYTVYKHISPDGKVYIGVTCQKDVNKRWRNGHGYFDNSHFKHAILKYGWDKFLHIIVASGLTQTEAYKIERELIEKYDSTNQEKGYNHDKGGKGSNEGHLCPEEVLAKKRASMKGKNTGLNLGGKSAKAKKVNQYDLDGNFIKTWGSTTEAQRAIGVDYTCVVRCCRGQNKTAGGFIWVYYGDDLLVPEKVRIASEPKQLSEKHKQNIRNGMIGISHKSLEKAVIGTEIKSGKTVYYGSMTEAERDGFSRTSISACISPNKPYCKTHKGYMWKFAE